MRLMSLYFSTIKQLVVDTPKKFHKPWQGPFKVVEVLGPTVYRIAECANPRRQKVVHFNQLKPAAEAESNHHLRLSYDRAHQDCQQILWVLCLMLVITIEIFHLPLYQWSLRIYNLSQRIDDLS